MAALAKSRANRLKQYKNLELAAKNEAVFKGGLACFDTSTGLVAKAFVSTTLLPIGLFHEDSAAATPKTVLVDLFREIQAGWFVNDGTVVAANVGGLAYIVDDQTVANADAVNTRSVAGRIWAIDAVKGVLVEPMDTAGQRTNSGLDA